MLPFGVIDTGDGVRGHGWLVGLETKNSREDLDDSQQDGFRDLAAGQAPSVPASSSSLPEAPRPPFRTYGQ
jgi:hypothetical protein